MDRRTQAPDVDPAQDGLGPAAHVDQLGDSPELETSDAVTVDDLQPNAGFTAVVHRPDRSTRRAPVVNYPTSRRAKPPESCGDPQT